MRQPSWYFFSTSPAPIKCAPEIRHGILSAVNPAELLRRFARDEKPIDNLSTALEMRLANIVPLSATQARLAAELVPHSRAQGLSLGDRCCLALAIERKLPVLAGDRR